MKNYEITIVFHPDLEMNLDPALGKVKKIITSVDGEIIKEENEGKKRLSYDIKGQDFGIYVYLTVALPPEAPGKIDSVFNITDEIIRHMILKEDPRRLQAVANREQAEAQSTETESAAKNTKNADTTKEAVSTEEEPADDSISTNEDLEKGE